MSRDPSSNLEFAGKGPDDVSPWTAGGAGLLRKSLVAGWILWIFFYSVGGAEPASNLLLGKPSKEPTLSANREWFEGETNN